MNEPDYRDEYLALKEFLTADRGWDTAGVDLNFYDGWFLYYGSRPLTIKDDGTVEPFGTEFPTARAALTALRDVAAPYFNNLEGGDDAPAV